MYYLQMLNLLNTGAVSNNSTEVDVCVRCSYLPFWWSQGPDGITQDARYLCGDISLKHICILFVLFDLFVSPFFVLPWVVESSPLQFLALA